MDDERVRRMWKFVRDGVAREGVEPDEDACVRKIRQLSNEGCSEQEVVDGFVKAVMDSPDTYFRTRKKPEESRNYNKGSLGHDFYNIQPKEKMVCARLLELPPRDESE